MDEPSLNDQPDGDSAQQPAPAAETSRRFRLNKQSLGGFLGWYLVMALIYLTMFRSNAPEETEAVMICGSLLFVFQIVLLIILFVTKDLRDVGFGILSAIGVNLVVSALLGLVTNGMCFIPFFKPLY